MQINSINTVNFRGLKFQVKGKKINQLVNKHVVCKKEYWHKSRDYAFPPQRPEKSLNKSWGGVNRIHYM